MQNLSITPQSLPKAYTKENLIILEENVHEFLNCLETLKKDRELWEIVSIGQHEMINPIDAIKNGAINPQSLYTLTLDALIANCQLFRDTTDKK